MRTSSYSVTKASTDRVMLREISRADKAPGAALRASMQNHELRTLRARMGLTQSQLAAILGYQSAMRISEFERPTNPLPIPEHIAFMIRIVAEDPHRFWTAVVDEEDRDDIHDPFAA